MVCGIDQFELIFWKMMKSFIDQQKVQIGLLVDKW